MEAFTLRDGQKFALLAVTNAYCRLPEERDVRLADGTWVLDRLPLDVEETWKKWIGSIRFKKLEKANLLLVRTCPSQVPYVLNDEDQRLAGDLSQIFHCLQLLGVPEYDGADLLTGSVVGDQSDVRQLSELDLFHPTKGYSRSPLTVESLERATGLREGLEEIEAAQGQYKRLTRGLNVLWNGLRQQVAADRNHQFVRSLEALILPVKGQTKNQFIHRCQTFCKASSDARTALAECFDMRSDTEHLNDREPSLSNHPPPKRENIAFQRTRQMEALASFAHSRILEDGEVRRHFASEEAQQAFWKKDDAERISLWGERLDLSSVRAFSEYDQGVRGRR